MAHVIVASKDKLFKGKTLEELKKLDTREFSIYLTSRERRNIMRNSSVIEDFVRRAQKRIAKKKIAKTHNRSMIIVPAMVGMKLGIHNGKDFFPVNIVEEMLGHRLGEFAGTRKNVKHGAAGVGATKSSSSLSVK